jgi:hypothetical protein
MLGGAVLQVLDIAATLAQAGTIRRQAREVLKNRPGMDQSAIDSAANGVVTVLIVLSFLGVGLWIWMAFANRAGGNWARITGSVLFGLGTVFYLGDLGVSTLTKLLLWLIGLATVILLWNRRSRDYFKPASSGYEYQPPGAASGYPATGPGPAPGQTAPPQDEPPPGQPPGSPPPAGPQDMPPPS